MLYAPFEGKYISCLFAATEYLIIYFFGSYEHVRLNLCAAYTPSVPF